MTKPLFRKQAVEHQQQNMNGHVLIIPKASLAACAICLFTLFFAVCWAAVKGTYTQKATVRGWLEPTEGIVQIYAPASTRTLAQLNVSEGDIVRSNSPLLSLTKSHILQNGHELSRTLNNQYRSQLASIENKLHLIKAQLEIDTQALLQQQVDLEKELSLITSLNAAITAKLNEEQKHFTSIQKLKAKGFASEFDVVNAHSRLLDIQSQHQRIQLDRISIVQRSNALEASIKKTPNDYEQTRESLLLQKSELTQKLAQTIANQHEVINAPVDAVVTTIYVKQGQQLLPNQPLVSLIPLSSEIEARLLVPVKSSGFIESGQNIELRYDAYPFEKFGLQQGEIVQVSKALVLPNQMPTIPIPFSEPSYLADAHIRHDTIQTHAKSITLKPGMTFSADIKLSNRNLFEWLLEPVFSVLKRT